MICKYFSVDKSPYKQNVYFITINEEVHKAIRAKFDILPISYHQIIIGLFGLRPNDYFHYIASKYNATISTSKGSRWKTVSFSNLKDANDFATECNKRFDYCVKQGYFNAK